MGSNQIRGTYRESRETTMRCYDLLPPAVREIMRNAIHSFATAPRLGLLQAGTSVDDLCDHLVRYDAQCSRRDADADWQEEQADYIAAQRPRRRRDWMDMPARRRRF